MKAGREDFARVDNDRNRWLPVDTGYRCRLIGKLSQVELNRLPWTRYYRAVQSYLTAYEYINRATISGRFGSVSLRKVKDLDIAVYDGIRIHPDLERHTYRGSNARCSK
jgi:hypothetical protein